MSIRGLRAWHRRIGWTAGLGLLVVLASGALLLFRGSWREEPPRGAPVAASLSLEAIVAAAEGAGGAPATDIELSRTPSAPYRVWLDDDRETEVFLQRDGRVLAVRRGAEAPGRWLYRLHTGELLGSAGRWVALTLALALLALVVSGWWTRPPWGRRRPRTGPGVARSAGAAAPLDPAPPSTGPGSP